MPSPTIMRIVTSNNQKYGLDFIPGAVDSCVAFFSYYRSTKYFNGQCVEVMRGSDYATAWFGYSGSLGYIDYIAIAVFCAGTTGKVREWVNGSVLSGVNNAIQANYANMPIIFEYGAFNTDGLMFVGTSSNYMNVVDYAGIQIIDPPLTIYTGLKNWTSSYIFAKNYVSTVDMQFGRAVGLYFGTVTLISPSFSEKTIITWKDKNANGFLFKSELQTINATASNTLVNANYFVIGARKNSEEYFGYGTFNLKTICIWNSNQYDNYTQLASKF